MKDGDKSVGAVANKGWQKSARAVVMAMKDSRRRVIMARGRSGGNLSLSHGITFRSHFAQKREAFQ